MSARPHSSRRYAFSDSSGFYALTDRDDTNHHNALAITRELQRQRWTVITSTYVIAEQHALHLARLGRDIAWRALTLIDQSDIRILPVTAADEARAREILARYRDKAWSFTDATSFAIMERHSIQHAFTFDRDFAQYGFTVLTPDLPLR